MVLLELQTGGDGQDRTADLLIANQSLSQLSYAPRRFEILRGEIRRVNPDCPIYRLLCLTVAATPKNRAPWRWRKKGSHRGKPFFGA
jgi:hypothetical protein